MATPMATPVLIILDCIPISHSLFYSAKASFITDHFWRTRFLTLTSWSLTNQNQLRIARLKRIARTQIWWHDNLQGLTSLTRNLVPLPWRSGLLRTAEDFSCPFGRRFPSLALPKHCICMYVVVASRHFRLGVLDWSCGGKSQISILPVALSWPPKTSPTRSFHRLRLKTAVWLLMGDIGNIPLCSRLSL